LNKKETQNLKDNVNRFSFFAPERDDNLAVPRENFEGEQVLLVIWLLSAQSCPIVYVIKTNYVDYDLCMHVMHEVRAAKQRWLCFSSNLLVERVSGMFRAV
jgi:hypothetical protein